MNARAMFLLTAAAFQSAVLGQTTFERFYGQNGWPECFFSVVQTPDDGFAAAGYTESYGADAGDFWLVRTDSLGSLQWMNLVTGPDNQCAYDVEPVWDGGFVACGHDYGNGGTSVDMLLVRYTPAGDTAWTRRFGTPDGAENAMAVVTSPDSCFVACGRASTPGHDLIKVSADGTQIWGRSYPGVNGSFLNSVERLADGYVLGGVTWDEQNNECIYVVRTDWDGDTVWTRAIRMREYNVGHHVKPTRDGGYIVCGASSDTLQPSQAALLKLTAAGDTEWTHTFPETYLWYDDFGTDVVEDRDGGFLLLAWDEAADSLQPFLAKASRSGVVEWTCRPGSAGRAVCYALALTRDAGLILAGMGELPDSAYGEAYLLKTDSRGRLAVVERPAAEPRFTGARPAPNPFRSSVHFVLPSDGPVARVVVADASGRIVYKSLRPDSVWKSGTLPAGVYCYRITAGGVDYRGRLVKLPR